MADLSGAPSLLSCSGRACAACMAASLLQLQELGESCLLHLSCQCPLSAYRSLTTWCTQLSSSTPQRRLSVLLHAPASLYSAACAVSRIVALMQTPIMHSAVWGGEVHPSPSVKDVPSGCTNVNSPALVRQYAPQIFTCLRTAGHLPANLHPVPVVQPSPCCLLCDL